MSYRIEVRREALGELEALPAPVRVQARLLVRGLGSHPRPRRARQLRGMQLLPGIPDIYRIWLAARWRIAYAIADEDLLVRILQIRRREDLDFQPLSSEILERGAGYGSENLPAGH